MKNFTEYLDQTSEIGFVEEVLHALVYVNGLPTAKPQEIVVFETGEIGQVMGLQDKYTEVLVFSKNSIRAGTRAARTGEFMQIPTGHELLGQTIDPLGYSLDQTKPMPKPMELRPIDVTPTGISTRKRIQKPFATGMTLVDLIIPLGKGQRELVIGDRKTGKTSFLLRSVLSQAQEGTICIYAAVGKKKLDIKKVEDYFAENKVTDKTIIIASGIEDPAGIIYITPYAAMSIAEYFRDQGQDVLLVLDDLFTHAKFYREISLLAKKFPGRNSYPGDIFYMHARLLERSGNFITEKGEAAITCLAVAETQAGDLSGYVQTNLMSMTDGHIFFDSNLFAQGRRPAINPFLSVTRVGRQTQTELKRQINRELTSFLTLFEKMQTFSHFGAEATATVKHTLRTGEKMYVFFDQTDVGLMPASMQLYLFCTLWSGIWEVEMPDTIRQDIANLLKLYKSDQAFLKEVDTMISSAKSFNGLINTVRTHVPSYIQKTRKPVVLTLPTPEKPKPVAAFRAPTQS